MPRATGVLVGETYQQMLSRTLPSTKAGLDMFGIYEGIDYVVVNAEVTWFYYAFQSPDKWDNTIHFSNGFIWIMVSNDQANSGRGINCSIVVVMKLYC
jgi:hypothetical protein